MERTIARVERLARTRKALGGLAATVLLVVPAWAGADDDPFCWSDAPVFAEHRISVKHKGRIAGLDGEPTYVVSNGVVRLKHHAMIDGDISAPRVRRMGRTNVTGEVSVAPAGESALPVDDLVEAYRIDNDNDLIPRTAKGRKALMGGHLYVRKGDHLSLPEGEYFLHSIVVRRGGVLEVEGRVRIFMEDGWVSLRRGSLAGTEEADLGFVIAGEGVLHVGARASFHAAVYAPESRFVLRNRGSASGSLVVSRMEVKERGEFLAEDRCVEEESLPPTPDEPPTRPPRPGTPPASEEPLPESDPAPMTDPTTDPAPESPPEDEFTREARPS